MTDKTYFTVCFLGFRERNYHALNFSFRFAARLNHGKSIFLIVKNKFIYVFLKLFDRTNNTSESINNSY